MLHRRLRLGSSLTRMGTQAVVAAVRLQTVCVSKPCASPNCVRLQTVCVSKPCASRFCRNYLYLLTRAPACVRVHVSACCFWHCRRVDLVSQTDCVCVCVCVQTRKQGSKRGNSVSEYQTHVPFVHNTLIVSCFWKSGTHGVRTAFAGALMSSR